MAKLLSAWLALAAPASSQVHLDVDKQLRRQEERVAPSGGSLLAQSLAAEAGLSTPAGVPAPKAVASLDRLLKQILARYPDLSELGGKALGRAAWCELALKEPHRSRVAKLSRGVPGRFYPDLGVEGVDRITRSLSGEYSFGSGADPAVSFSRPVDGVRLAPRYRAVPEVDRAECGMARRTRGRGARPRSASLTSEAGRWRLKLSNCLAMRGDFCARSEARTLELDFDAALGEFVAWRNG